MADAYLANVKALFHFDTPEPWIDSAGHTVATAGTPQTASVSGQFGTSVMNCANGASLSITHADMVIPEFGAFTLEARISVPAGLTVTEETTWWVAGNADVAIGCTLWPGDNDWYMAVNRGGVTQWIAAGPGRDVLTHIAISQVAGTTGVYGCCNGAVPYLLEPTYSTGTTMHFGNVPGGSAFPGKVEEIRFTKGVTRYAGTYTVPTGAFDDPSIPFVLSLPISVTVSGGGEVLALPLSVVVVPAANFGFQVSVPIAVTSVASVSAPFALSVPIGVSVVPAGNIDGSSSVAIGTAGHAACFGAVVTINGDDVSDKIGGMVSVDAEEGAARIAEIIVRLDAGTELDLPAWTGASVTIEVADFSSGQPIHRMVIFSGVVDTPELDQAQRTLALRCTDDLQGRCAALSNAQILALTGGLESDAIFDAAAIGWDYAQDRLSTVPAALDISPAGQIRVTPWAAKSTADIDLSALIGENSIALQIAERSGLINEVLVEFSYRFPRVKAECYPVNFTLVDMTGFAQFILDGKWFLQRAQVEAAISEAGGTVVEITYTPLPTTIIAVGSGFFTPSAADLELCMGFSASVTFDYAQTTEERHRITVRNARSIAAVGQRKETISGALEGVYPDLTAVETNIKLFRDRAVSVPPADLATPMLEKTTSAEVSLTAETNRDAANKAMAALVAVAKNRVRASHRETRVSAVVPLNPAIDLDKTLSLNVDGVVAKGKCTRVVHRMDHDAGVAVSEVSIALCSVAGVGIVHADDIVTDFAATTATTTALETSVNIEYHAGNTDDHVIKITFPGVEEAERANAIVAIERTVEAGLDEDVFSITL